MNVNLVKTQSTVQTTNIANGNNKKTQAFDKCIDEKLLMQIYCNVML